MAPAEEVGLVWFRRDLRLEDNPAWAAATAQRKFVVPLYVIDPTLLGSVGPYRRRQLIANLQALDYDLFEATGGRLHVRFGDPRAVVPEGIDRLGATALFVNADVSSFARRRDDAVAAAINVPVESWFGSLVLPPGRVLTTKGALSKAFNAFHKTWVKTDWDDWPEPNSDPVVYEDPGEPLPFLDDQPPFFEGAKEARRRLDAVLARLDDDAEPTDAGAQITDHLASDLRYGTISARSVATALGDATPARQLLVRQLARRDWYAHQLAQAPTLASEEQVIKYRSIPWRNAAAQISAWKGGFTGYPIVDAAMRELRETGRMEHHARVVASSFLVKDLLVDWRVGEKHFRHLLVDADPSQNAGNWQRVAGTGHDAAPINRVIDPVDHSRRHDPTGAYIRRWVPELASLDDDAVHAPWLAPADAVLAAGVQLGRDYPDPIVDHTAARDEFLAAIRPGAARAARNQPASPEPSPVELVPSEADPEPLDALGGGQPVGASSEACDAAPDGPGAGDERDALEPPAAAS
jgi:deoxyribodipyrimidine photo-lyase